MQHYPKCLLYSPIVWGRNKKDFSPRADSVLVQIIGRLAEAGDLYLIQSGRDTNGECKLYNRLISSWFDRSNDWATDRSFDRPQHLTPYKSDKEGRVCVWGGGGGGGGGGKGQNILESTSQLQNKSADRRTDRPTDEPIDIPTNRSTDRLFNRSAVQFAH